VKRVERSMTSACNFKSKKLKKLNFCEVTAASQLSKNFKLKDKFKELEKQSLVVYHIRC
jgi:hypothetical protein